MKMVWLVWRNEEFKQSLCGVYDSEEKAKNRITEMIWIDDGYTHEDFFYDEEYVE